MYTLLWHEGQIENKNYMHKFYPLNFPRGGKNLCCEAGKSHASPLTEHQCSKPIFVFCASLLSFISLLYCCSCIGWNTYNAWTLPLASHSWYVTTKPLWWWGGWVYWIVFMFSLSFFLSIYLCLSIYLPLSVCLSIYLSIYLSVCLPIYLSLFISIHPSIHPSTSLSPGFCVPRPEQYNAIS